MAAITIVGTGPGPLRYLTKEAERELLSADKIFFRTSQHPVYDWLKENRKRLISFDTLYTIAGITFTEIYAFIADALVTEAKQRGHAHYALPGSASVLEDTTRLLKLQESDDLRIRVVPGMSFLDLVFTELNVDLTSGVQLVLPYTHLRESRFDARLALLVCQIEALSHPLDKPNADLTMRWLLKTYPPGHAVTLIWTEGIPEYHTHAKQFALKDLAREYGQGKYFASLYVPPLG